MALVLLGLGPWVAPAWGDKGKKKLSTREMKKKMNGWAREIGVKCAYCHVKDGDEFDYEAETPKKKIASYCEEHFVDVLQLKKRQVSCQDCHKRKARFLPRSAPEDSSGEGR